MCIIVTVMFCHMLYCCVNFTSNMLVRVWQNSCSSKDIASESNPVMISMSLYSELIPTRFVTYDLTLHKISPLCPYFWKFLHVANVFGHLWLAMCKNMFLVFCCCLFGSLTAMNFNLSYLRLSRGQPDSDSRPWHVCEIGRCPWKPILQWNPRIFPEFIPVWFYLLRFSTPVSKQHFNRI